jgi:hypothetical protein
LMERTRPPLLLQPLIRQANYSIILNKLNLLHYLAYLLKNYPIKILNKKIINLPP